MGKFAENLNLGKRVLPLLRHASKYKLSIAKHVNIVFRDRKF